MTNPEDSAALALIAAFNDAFNRRDLDAVMALMTKDAVFENTAPPPDGARHVGQAAVRAAFAAIFAASPRLHFDYEEVFSMGGRGVVRWSYHWDTGPQDRGHIRGVDVLRLRDGRIAEKLSYVKG